MKMFMIPRIVFSLIGLQWLISASVNGSQEEFSTVDFPDFRERQYQIKVYRSSAYGQNDNQKKIPVIYVADGYWFAERIKMLHETLDFRKQVPSILIVSLGYSGEKPDYDHLRIRDLLPGSNIKNEYLTQILTNLPITDADLYLKFLESEVFPRVERDFNGDPENRFLFGCSAGGTFTLYAMFKNPGLFKGYVAESPYAAPLFLIEKRFAESGKSIDAWVYSSVGEYEYPSFRTQIQTLWSRIASRSYLKHPLFTSVVPFARHTSAQASGFSQGMLYVLQDLAPEKGVDSDFSINTGKKVFGVSFSPVNPNKTECINVVRSRLIELMNKDSSGDLTDYGNEIGLQAWIRSAKTAHPDDIISALIRAKFHLVWVGA
jgi:predicted alpha/beta superfamily hydrolase